MLDVQVGNYTQDQYYYGRLEDMTSDANPRPAYFTTTANGAPLCVMPAASNAMHAHAARLLVCSICALRPH